MSYGSDYRDRQRRTRRREQRLVFRAIRSLVATAALIAIAFAFDVPEKIREKLRPRAPEAVAARDESAVEARERAPVDLSSDAAGISSRRHPPLPRDFSNEHQQTVPGENELAESPENPSHDAALSTEVERNSQTTKEDEYTGRRVKLELDKKQMKILLPELVAGENRVDLVRVIGLRNLKEKFELKPASGLVGANSELQILFPEYPRARFLVRTDKIGQRIFLVVEPQMALWADQPMPYTLNKIKSEAFKTRRAADEFFSSLAATQAELPRLKNWLETARNIPLDDFKKGTFRVKELESLIPRLEGRVEEVEQGVQQVNALEGFVRVLHNRTELQFVVADSR